MRKYPASSSWSISNAAIIWSRGSVTLSCNCFIKWSRRVSGREIEFSKAFSNLSKLLFPPAPMSAMVEPASKSSFVVPLSSSLSLCNSVASLASFSLSFCDSDFSKRGLFSNSSSTNSAISILLSCNSLIACCNCGVITRF